jgi:hypothetical protein
MSISKLVKEHQKNELLEMCEDNGITCRKSWTKEKIAEALHAAGKKKKTSKSKIGKSSKKKSSKKKSSKKGKKLKTGLECDMEQKVCEKSSKYRKADIVALAAQCGVDTKGTRKQLCERIAGAIGGGVAPPIVQPHISSKKPTPVGGGLPNTGVMVKGNTKNELLDMCAARIPPLRCLKSWNKAKIAKELRKTQGIAPCVPTPTPPSVPTPTLPGVPPPTPPSVPTPTPGVGPQELCFDGYSYDDLVDKKVTELRKLLEKAGVKSGRPTKKVQMAQYLCDVARNPRCDVAKGVECDGDQICDASNQPGVCISPALANQRGYDSMMWGNKKVIGTKAALEKLKKIIDAKPAHIPTPHISSKIDLPTDIAKEIKAFVRSRRIGATHTVINAEIKTIAKIIKPLVAIIRAGTVTPGDLPDDKELNMLGLMYPRDELFDGVIANLMPQTPLIVVDELIPTPPLPTPTPRTPTPPTPTPPTPTPPTPTPRTPTPRTPTPRTPTPSPVKPRTPTPSPVKPRTPTPSPIKPRTPTPSPVKPRTPTPSPVKPPSAPKPPEGTAIVDIEEILRQIQQGGGDEIGELAATQSAVLKCLGLLS